MRCVRLLLIGFLNFLIAFFTFFNKVSAKNRRTQSLLPLLPSAFARQMDQSEIKLVCNKGTLIHKRTHKYSFVHRASASGSCSGAELRSALQLLKFLFLFHLSKRKIRTWNNKNSHFIGNYMLGLYRVFLLMI